MVHPDDRDLVLSNFQESSPFEEPTDPGTPDHRDAAALLIRWWVHGRITHGIRPDGRLVRSAGTVQDVTDRRDAQTEMLLLAHDRRLDRTCQPRGVQLAVQPANCACRE